MFWMGQYVHVLNLQRELIEPVCTLGNVVKELPVRNAQRCCSAAEWLQEALQNSCKEAGCSSRKFWLFGAAL